MNDRAEVGARAERLVADHLARLGLTILGTNVRVGRLEIDIVAREGPVIVIVEVRARGGSSWQRPFDSVDAKKRARIRRAGEALWRSRFRGDRTIERMRFDVASVDLASQGGPTIEIARAAF